MFSIVFQNISLDKRKSQTQAQFPQSRILGECFRVLTVHNTTQSMIAYQVIVLCCNTCFKEIPYNAYYHHGQAPIILVGQITLRPCSSKTLILHIRVQTYSSGFCDVLHYRAETRFETISTKYSPKQQEQIDKVLRLCSSTLTHKMLTTEIIVKT